MSDLAKYLDSNNYLKALKATDQIESPALGFARPSDYKTTLDLQKALIKQNNTLISLFLGLSEQVLELTEQVQGLKKNLTPTQTPKELEKSIEDLTKQIGALHLGKDPTIPKKKGSILVFRNPSDILAQEKKK